MEAKELVQGPAGRWLSQDTNGSAESHSARRCCYLQGQVQSTCVPTDTAPSFQTSGTFSQQLERWQLSRIAAAGDSASQCGLPSRGGLCPAIGHPEWDWPPVPRRENIQISSTVETAEPPLRHHFPAQPGPSLPTSLRAQGAFPDLDNGLV